MLATQSSCCWCCNAFFVQHNHGSGEPTMAVLQIFMMQCNLGSGVLRRWQWGVGRLRLLQSEARGNGHTLCVVVMALFPWKFVPTGKCFVVFFKTMSTILMANCSVQLSLSHQCATIEAPPTGQCFSKQCRAGGWALLPHLPHNLHRAFKLGKAPPGKHQTFPAFCRASLYDQMLCALQAKLGNLSPFSLSW